MSANGLITRAGLGWKVSRGRIASGATKAQSSGLIGFAPQIDPDPLGNRVHIEALQVLDVGRRALIGMAALKVSKRA